MSPRDDMSLARIAPAESWHKPALLRASVSDRPFSETRPRTVEILEGASLADMVEAALPDPVLRAHAVLEMSGEIIDRTDWHRIRPKPAAIITISVRPAGGGDGDGNKFLRTILQIAVIALATWIGGGAGGAIASQWMAAAAAAATVVVGNLAINALVPLPEPAGLSRDRSSPSYSIEGARNRADPYGPVQVPFGKTRLFPKFLGLPYQESVGDDIYLRGLLSLGPIGLDYEAVKIGETLASAFSGWEFEARTQPDDPPITLYANDPFPELVGADLDGPGSPVTRTTQADTTEIIVALDFPLGLGARDNKGRNVSASATVLVEAAPVSEASSWFSYRPNTRQANTALPPGTNRRNYFGVTGTIEDWRDNLPGVGALQGGITYSRSDPGKPFRREVRIAVPAGQYYVRVTRTDTPSTDDQVTDLVQFSQLISINPADPNPNDDHAELAFRIKASGELSGVVDTINLIVKRHGPTLDAAIADAADPDLSTVTQSNWQTTAETRNCADMALFAARGPQNEYPTPDANIDWPAWAAFWRWCRDNDFNFDWTLDETMRRDDLLRLICAAGRARPARVNGKLTVIVDAPRADPPGKLFTPRNVRGFRSQKSFPGEVHALRVAFTNSEEDYRRDERIVYADGYSADGAGGTTAATLFERIALEGVTHPDHVYKLARFHWATALQQTERFTFEQDVESITVTLGELAALQHDVIVVGLGAFRVVSRTLDGSGDVETLTFDAPLEMEAGKSYGIRWRKIDASGNVALEDATPIDTVAGSSRTVTLTTPHPVADAPEVDDVVAYGEYEQETIPVLIKNIQPRGDFEATIEAVAEAPGRYQAADGAIPTFNTGITTPIRRRPDQPTLSATSVTADGIYIRFDYPDGRVSEISHFEVARRISPEPSADGNFEPLPPIGASERVAVLPPGLPGEEYDGRIVAVDHHGRQSDPLIVLEIEADNIVATPANVSAIGETINSSAGAQIPALTVSADANEDFNVELMIVEIKANGAPDGDYRVLDAIPAAAPQKSIPVPDWSGASLDARFTFRTRRGVVSATPAEINAISIPSVFRALDSGAVDGLTRAAIEALDAARQAEIDALEAANVVVNAELDQIETDLAAAEADIIAAQNDVDDAQAEIDAAADAMSAGAVDLAAGLLAERDRLADIDRTTHRRIDALTANLAGVTAGLEQTRSVLVEDGRSIVRLSERLYSAVDGSIAAIEADYMTAAGTDSAIAAFNLELNATFAGLSDDVDAAETNVANILADYMTASMTDSAIAAFNLELNATFAGLSDDVDAAEAAIVTNATSSASRDRALARRQDALTANLAGVTAGLEQTRAVIVENGRSIVRLSERLYSAVDGSIAAIEADYMTAADTDSAIAAFNLELNATFAGLSDDVDAAEAAIVTNATSSASRDRALARRQDALTANLAGVTAGLEQTRSVLVENGRSIVRLSERLYSAVDGSIAAIEADYMTAAGTDSAIAAFNLELNATFAGLSDDVDAAEANVAAIQSDYMTAAGTDSAIAAFNFNLNATFSALADDVAAAEADIDQAEADIVQNAAASASSDRALARRQDALTANLAGVTAGLEQTRSVLVENGRSIARLSERLYSAVDGSVAAIEADYMTAAGTDSAIAAFNLELNSTFAGLSDDVDAAEASIAVNTATLADHDGRLQAYFNVEANAAGSQAFISLIAIDDGDNTTSNVALGARAISFWNELDSVWVEAAKIEFGDLRLYGSLIAGAGIFQGDSNAKWPVALQSKVYSLADGDSQEYGFTFNEIPEILIDATGLDPLAAGEAYVLGVTNSDEEGFTASLKITTPGTTTAVTENTNATSGLGAGVEHAVAAGDNSKAYNGRYVFYVDVTIPINAKIPAGEPVLYQGNVTIRPYIYDGTNWVYGFATQLDWTAVDVAPTHTSGTVNHVATAVPIVMDYFGDVDFDAVNAVFGAASLGSTYAFGTPTLDDLDRVEYAKQNQSGTRTASPNGEEARFTVMPRNLAT